MIYQRASQVAAFVPAFAATIFVALPVPDKISGYKQANDSYDCY
jgi:hypothetical protein